MNILKYSKLYYLFSIIVLLVGVLALFQFGLKLSIDFTGGSLLEIKVNDQTDTSITKEALEKELESKKVENLQIQKTDQGFILRFKEIDEKTHSEILTLLKNKWPSIEEIRFDSIGPVIGNELKRKSISATIGVLLAITFYVAFAFRKTSQIFSGWRYGLITLLTLAHDVLITIGLFALIAFYLNYEIGTPFITALLTVLGFSVHDTIVVFDRIRENIFKLYPKVSLYDIVNSSLIQTLARSINTSVSTILPLIVVFLFGGATLKAFVLTLIIGISFGTYSSIFIASPLLINTLKIKKAK